MNVNYKKIMMCAAIGASMQNARGMYQQGYNQSQYPQQRSNVSNNNNNQPSYPNAPLMSPSNSIRPNNSNNQQPYPALVLPVESEFAQLATMIKALSLSVDNMNKGLNDRMTAMENKIGAIEKKVDSIRSPYDRFSLGDVKTSFDTVQTKLDRIGRNTYKQD